MCFFLHYSGGRWMIGGVVSIFPNLNVPVVCGFLGLQMNVDWP